MKKPLKFFLIPILLGVLFIWVGTRQKEATNEGYNVNSQKMIQIQPSLAGIREFRGVTDVTLQKTDGSSVLISDLWKKTPLLIEFGSASCPIYGNNEGLMDEIYEEFDAGEQKFVRVALVYTREAHPGWRRPSHQSLEMKIEAAKALQKGIQREVLVDTLDGELHRQLGGLPNSVALIDQAGSLRYFSAWNDPSILRELLYTFIEDRAVSLPFRKCPRPSYYYSSLSLLASGAKIGIAGGIDALADFLLFGVFLREESELDRICEVEQV